MKTFVTGDRRNKIALFFVLAMLFLSHDIVARPQFEYNFQFGRPLKLSMNGGLLFGEDRGIYCGIEPGFKGVAVQCGYGFLPFGAICSLTGYVFCTYLLSHCI